MAHENLIQQFIDAMTQHGCAPARASDIVADDKWHRYTVIGDKKPNARYQLRIDGDFAIGRYIYFKDGESHAWHSKSNRKLTPEEKKAYAARVRAEKAEHEAQQAKEYERVAAECLAVWRGAKEMAHPYPTKKGVCTAGTRVADIKGADGKIQKNILLVPVYKNNRISSLQRIWPNGFKAFWEGGDVNGGYTALPSVVGDNSTIIITEGWATGKSIHDATGMPVIIAFNSGNLLPVGLLMRKKYPHARIVFAADNDQWTADAKGIKHIKGMLPKGVKDYKDTPAGDPLWQTWLDKGYLWNTGLTKARAAAVKIGAHVIFPNFPFDTPEKFTDFNDMHAALGLPAVNDRILVAAPAIAPQDRGVFESYNEDAPSEFSPDVVPAYLTEVPMHDIEDFQSLYAGETKSTMPEVQNWRELLYYKEDETVKGNSLMNARVFIEHDPDYKGLFCYDEFTHEKVVAFKPPWEDTEKFSPRPLRDEDVTCLAMHMEQKGMALNINNLRKVLDACIMANAKNPAQEYFKKLVWDGVPRLDTWLRTYCGATVDDPEYIAAVGKKWVTAAVARVMNPGCKFDNILILEGGQNLGKSFLLKELVTIHGRAYFDDTIKAKDLTLDKTVPKLQGVIVIELAEMSGFKRMPVDEAKQVISTQADRIVKKYANEPTLMPRQFVFAGTINPLNGYLSDPTGDRRYWPVTCTKIDIPGIRKMREQLWAEAMHLYQNGEDLFLSDEIYEKAEIEQRRRQIIHPWQIDLEKLANAQDKIDPEDIWGALLITDRSRRTQEAQDTIASIMAGLGYAQERRRHNGGRKNMWVKQNPAQEDFFETHGQEPEEIDF